MCMQTMKPDLIYVKPYLNIYHFKLIISPYHYLRKFDMVAAKPIKFI